MNSAVSASNQEPELHPRPIQVIGLFPELSGVGGVQEASRLTAAAISEIVAQRGGAAEFLSLNDPPGSRVIDVAGRAISYRGFRRAKGRFALSAIIHARKSHGKMPAVVIAAHPNLAIPADVMKRIVPRLRVIVVSHGIEVWRPLSTMRRKALRRSQLVLAPSRYTGEKLNEIQRVAKERIRRLPWPVNPDFERLADDGSKLPLPPGFPNGRIVLTVGRWAASERYKGVDDLIHAIAQLRHAHPELQLVAVGEGDDVERLAHIAATLSVGVCVHFLSGLSRNQIAACYSRAEIFALPSSGEGYGLVFLEAMTFAKPVVGAAAGGAVDLIQDGVNGILVPPRDSQKLIEALSSLLSDERLRTRLGRAGADMVRKHYSFAAFKDGLDRILDECISADIRNRRSCG
jgi:phosphatidylinositol alpha-1,6-mannosyltransferase